MLPRIRHLLKYLRNLLRIVFNYVFNFSTDIDLTLREDINLNKSKIARFVELPKNWGPGTRAGKTAVKSWHGKRKRESSEEIRTDNREENSDSVQADVRQQ